MPLLLAASGQRELKKEKSVTLNNTIHPSYHRSALPSDLRLKKENTVLQLVIVLVPYYSTDCQDYRYISHALVNGKDGSQKKAYPCFLKRN